MENLASGGFVDDQLEVNVDREADAFQCMEDLEDRMLEELGSMQAKFDKLEGSMSEKMQKTDSMALERFNTLMKKLEKMVCLLL